MEPTATQLAARNNPTPYSVNLPTEGATFRDAGDNMGSTLYQIKNGQMVNIGGQQGIANTDMRDPTTGTIYKQGQVIPTEVLNGKTGLEIINPNFRGTNISYTQAGALYDKTNGSGAYSSLPTFNIADIQTALAHGGKFGTTTQLNDKPNANANDATIAAAKAATALQTAGTAGKNVQTQTDAQGNITSESTTPLAGGGYAKSQIPTSQPGSTATNLYDYFTSKGQSLPSVSDRGATFEKLGLGAAGDYKGTADQNEELLSAIQRNDHAQTTIGSQTGANAPVNTTPAGSELAKALAGGDASTTLANYKTYLASALGVAQDKINADENAVSGFFSTEKTADQILNEEMDRQGITESNATLAELDKEITAQSTTLEKLPDDIRTTLQDVGVSQAQLDRLVTAESKAPTKALNDLMTKRNALSTEIDKAMGFAQKFADTRIAAQASKLAALEWQVNSDRSDFSNLDGDMKTVLNAAIEDRKTVMTTALDAAKNGASAETVDAILGSSSAAAAIQAAGPSLVKPAKTSGTTQMTADISDAGSAFDSGVSAKGYNGVGPDGYIDPNLYTALYSAAVKQYGAAGGTSFLKMYPPTGGGKFTKGIKGLNPANIGQGTLPPAINNILLGAQKVSKATIIK